MPMEIDLRDPENVWKLIVALNDAETQMSLPLQEPLDFSDLRTKAGAAE